MDNQSVGRSSKRTNDGNPVWRICFANEEPNKALIVPCRCEDANKYVHEACLKSWILIYDEIWDERRCESCHTKFNMTGQYKNIFKCKLWFCVSIKYMLWIPIVIFWLSVYALYAVFNDILLTEYAYRKDIIIGAVWGLVLLSFMAIICQLWAISDMFYEKTIQNWKILPFEDQTGMSISNLDSSVQSVMTGNAVNVRANNRFNRIAQDDDSISQLSAGDIHMIRNQYRQLRGARSSYSSSRFDSLDFTTVPI